MSTIYEIVRECTEVFRHGPVVEEERAGMVTVTHVWFNTLHERDAPTDPVTHALVDTHFLVVAVDRAKAEEYRDEFVAALECWPPDKTYMPDNRLAGGPSYIELGAQLGDQGLAFQFMAMGEVLGLWQVITPKKMLPGVSDEEAQRLAGGGLVMISGYKGGAESIETPDPEPSTEVHS
ncbi:MAG: hypothetical protein ABW167_07785 [Baekduia sp.]